MINWDNILLKAASDHWLSPFPHADKAAAFWRANTHTQTGPRLLCSLPRACASQPARQCHSVASLERHPNSSSWPRLTHGAQQVPGGHPDVPFSLRVPLATQRSRNKGKLKDTLKLGFGGLDGLTQQPSDMTGAITTSPFKRKHRPLHVKTSGFTSPLQYQLAL